MSKPSRLLVAAFAALVGASALSPSLFAQDAPASWATRLRVATKEGRVALSWVDAPSGPDSYAVYRSASPFDAAALASAVKVGLVSKGAQSCLDQPPDDRGYYYLVLGLAADGSPIVIFVPGDNTTAAPISLAPAAASPAPQAAPAAPPAAPAAAPAPTPQAAPSAQAAAPAAAPSKAVAQPKPSAQPRPTVQPASPAAAPAAAAPIPAAPTAPSKIEGLAAKATGEAIFITFAGGAGKRMVIYRGTAPMADASDLLDAILISTFENKGGRFVDFPVPGIDYWYALLFEDDLKAGRIELVGGRNATRQSVRVAMTRKVEAVAEVSPVSRTPPLPSFLLDAATGVAVPQSPLDIPARSRISPEAEKAVAAIMSIAPPISRPQPALRLLPEELAPPSGGEDYALSLIVTQKLSKGEWIEAAEQLRKYLSLNRGKEASSRARFYLGQALALSGSYREAFFELLSARDLHPTETAPWIEYVLAAMRQG